MKRILLTNWIFLITISCIAQSNKSLITFQHIDSLITEKDFFVARNVYHSKKATLSKEHQLILEANLDHVFNRLAASNQKINQLFQQFSKTLPDSLKCKLLVIKQNNHGKLFEYKEAFTTLNQVMNQYNRFLSKAEQEDFANTRLIWKSLSGQPKQQVHIATTTTLKIKRDKAGLANIHVSYQGAGTAKKDSADFVFDTGANISTVTESMAKKCGMQFMEGMIDVIAITGKTVKSRIAVCPQLNLGNIQVQNAVFLVFPDSALAVPSIQYQIQGILGFPVIEALKEIQITRSEELIVPLQPGHFPNQNMTLDFLTPIIDLDGDNYTFDTGANSTLLYKTYFEKHRNEIEKNYKEQELQFGGAGGNIRKQGYLINFVPSINNKPVKIENVQVYKESIKADERHLSGNIGQDLIRKFDKMIISFASMSVHFE